MARENLPDEMDPEAALERISALEAEYQAAKAKSDDLWYKANTGQSREELGLDGGQPQRRRIHENKESMNKLSAGAKEAPPSVLRTLAAAGVERLKRAVSTSYDNRKGGYFQV